MDATSHEILRSSFSNYPKRMFGCVQQAFFVRDTNHSNRHLFC